MIKRILQKIGQSLPYNLDISQKSNLLKSHIYTVQTIHNQLNIIKQLQSHSQHTMEANILSPWSNPPCSIHGFQNTKHKLSTSFPNLLIFCHTWHYKKNQYYSRSKSVGNRKNSWENNNFRRNTHGQKSVGNLLVWNIYIRILDPSIITDR